MPNDLPVADPRDIGPASQLPMASPEDLGQNQSPGSRYVSSGLTAVDPYANPISIVKGLAKTIGTSPIDFVAAHADLMAEGFKSGAKDLKAGNYGTGLAKILLAGSPYDKAREQIQSGDVAGGLGTITGITVGNLLPLAAEKGIGALSPTLNRAGTNLAERTLRAANPTTNPDVISNAASAQLENKILPNMQGLSDLRGHLQNLAEATAQVPVGKGVVFPKNVVEDVAAGTESIRKSFDIPGHTADVSAVENTTKDFLDKFTKKGTPATPSSQVATGVLDANGNPVMRTVPGTPGTPDVVQMTAEEAQSLKSRINPKTTFGKAGTAVDEANKALVYGPNGLNSILSQAFPELDQLNAAQHEALQLKPLLVKEIRRGVNMKFAGVKDLLFEAMLGTSTALYTGSAKAGGIATAGYAAMRYVLANPVIRTRIAIGLYQAGKGSITFPQAVARVATVSNALSQSSPPENTAGSETTPQPGQ